MNGLDRSIQSKEEILATIKDHRDELHRLGVKELWLVGSAARDQLTSKSDVDVIVSLDQPLGLAFFEIGIQMEKWLGRHVDVSTKNGVHERALKAMEEEAIRAAI